MTPLYPSEVQDLIEEFESVLNWVDPKDESKFPAHPPASNTSARGRKLSGAWFDAKLALMTWDRNFRDILKAPPDARLHILAVANAQRGIFRKKVLVIIDLLHRNYALTQPAPNVITAKDT